MDSQVPVVLSSLSGRNMVLSLRKRPGMEAEDVLDTGKSEGECSYPPFPSAGLAGEMANLLWLMQSRCDQLSTLYLYG